MRWAVRVAAHLVLVTVLLVLTGCETGYGGELKDNTGSGVAGDATCGGHTEDGPAVDERGEEVVAWYFVHCDVQPQYHEIHVHLTFRESRTDEWRNWGQGRKSTTSPDRDGFRLMLRGPCADGYYRVAIKRVHGVTAAGNKFDLVENSEVTRGRIGTRIRECQGRWD